MQPQILAAVVVLLPLVQALGVLHLLAQLPPPIEAQAVHRQAFLPLSPLHQKPRAITQNQFRAITIQAVVEVVLHTEHHSHTYLHTRKINRLLTITPSSSHLTIAYIIRSKLMLSMRPLGNESSWLRYSRQRF